jgi:hypothetical protein
MSHALGQVRGREAAVEVASKTHAISARDRRDRLDVVERVGKVAARSRARNRP